MDVIKLNGTIRKAEQKSETNELRRSGQVPGVLYHKGDENIHFSVKSTELLTLIQGGQAHVVEITFDNGQKRQGLLKELQFDPVGGSCIHFDLQAVAGDEKITVSVPVTTTGTSVGVKVHGGLLTINLHHVRVRADKQHLPDHIILDITDLEVGQAIHAGEIHMDGIQIMEDPSAPVVSVARKRVDDQVATAEPSLAEPEVVTKGKKETV